MNAFLHTKMVMDTFCFRIFAAVLHRLLHKNREVKMNTLIIDQLVPSMLCI